MSFFNRSAWAQGGRTLPSRIPQCGKCGLFKTCESPKMPPAGKGKRSVLLVAEAPGEAEDASGKPLTARTDKLNKYGKPLVGKSAQLVIEVLEELGVRLDDLHRTNAVICRPPENKMEDLYIDCCRPNLLKTIRELQPKVIVLMGGASVKSLIPTEREGKVGGIGRWAGWTVPSKEYGAWLCPTYHPAYLLRMGNKVLDRTFKAHLQRALELENEPVEAPSLDELKRKVECLHSTQETRSRLKDLLRSEGRPLAFDYECTGLKPEGDQHRIVTCSFSDGEDTFAFSMGDPKVERLVSRILQDERFAKIGALIKFEERWTREKLGHGVVNWDWDTVVVAHILDQRGEISSVKFQAFIHFGVADYNSEVAWYLETIDPKTGTNRILECPRDKLLLYNGIDSLVEFWIAQRQKKELAR